MKFGCIDLTHQLHHWVRLVMSVILLSASGVVYSAGLLTPLGSAQPLEMLSHKVQVTIQDGFATTTVEQVFANQASQAMDAQYRFPVPEEAAVGEFTYWIQGQPIHGEVVEKQQAEQIYQEEKQAGRDVALTEQDSFVHFDIKVAQIPPGQDARIKLVYVQPIEIDHGIGRYVYPLESGGPDEEEKAFWTMKSAVRQQFDFDVSLKSGFSVDAVRLPMHPQAQLQQLSSQEWSASVSSGVAEVGEGAASHGEVPENNGEVPESHGSTVAFNLDQDIVFYWRLQDGTPGALDVLAYKADPQSTGTVMMTLTPADDLQLLSQGTDWTLLLDISGSMSGKFQTLVEGVKQGLRKFNPQDRVRIILFNRSTQDLSGGFVQATQENLQQLVQQLEQVTPGDSTNLMAGLRKSLRGHDADRTSAIWLVTDGVANVGETQQKYFLRLLEKNDIRLFTFIMGNSANRPLLKAMSKASNGFALSVSNADDIVGQLEKAASKVSHQALHDVKVTFNGVSVKDIHPQTIGSLYRGQQLQLFGHYWQGGEGELVVTAKRSGQQITYRLPVRLPEVAIDYPELERLWAFSQIDALMDEQRAFGENGDRKDAVIDLAKTYSLVTPYTSMLVLEEAQFDRYGIERLNDKRINLEREAREQWANRGITNHNQAENHPVHSKPRSTLGGGGGGGAIGVQWILAVLLVLYWRRKTRKFWNMMS